MDTRHVLGANGLLAQHIDGYEERPQQIEMAALIEQCIAAGRDAVIEAGTGVGKSLAYLSAAVLSGRQTIVSTANKTLQAQLITSLKHPQKGSGRRFLERWEASTRLSR